MLADAEVVNQDEGSDFRMQVFTGNNPDIGCFLDTPNNERIEFKPEDKSSAKYELQAGNVITHCAVIVKNLTPNDAGTWKLSYSSDVEQQTVTYELTVNPG